VYYYRRPPQQQPCVFVCVNIRAINSATTAASSILVSPHRWDANRI